MSQLIKLYWEFRGPTALQTAEHHVIHLKEYMQMKQFKYLEANTHNVSEFNCMAYLITHQEYLQPIRTDLNPTHGTLYTPETS